MPFTGDPITLSAEERLELVQMTQSRALPAADVFRARLILLLADGVSYRTIQQRLDTTAPTISRWKNRFAAQRVAGLLEIRHPGQKPAVITPVLQDRVLEATRRKPTDGSTDSWSCRKLAKHLNLSKDTVQRIWHQAGVRPHRLERFAARDNPDFERQSADIIGLYLCPPQHAAVFCLEGKATIQAQERSISILPSSGVRAERDPSRPYGQGTLALYAAFDGEPGAVESNTPDSRTSQEFGRFLGEIVSRCRPMEEIHLLLDNRSAHDTDTVRVFLREHPNVTFHFTPTHTGWLSEIGRWLSQIEREAGARGISPSVPDLARKLMRYIRARQKTARPFRWNYSGDRGSPAARASNAD